jgi:hypothetical protein
MLSQKQVVDGQTCDQLKWFFDHNILMRDSEKCFPKSLYFLKDAITVFRSPRPQLKTI